LLQTNLGKHQQTQPNLAKDTIEVLASGKTQSTAQLIEEKLQEQ